MTNNEKKQVLNEVKTILKEAHNKAETVPIYGLTEMLESIRMAISCVQICEIEVENSPKL